MWIVCKQWFAGDSAIAADDPVVACGECVSVKTDAIQCGGSNLLVVRELRECFSRNWLAFYPRRRFGF